MTLAFVIPPRFAMFSPSISLFLKSFNSPTTSRISTYETSAITKESPLIGLSPLICIVVIPSKEVMVSSSQEIQRLYFQLLESEGVP